MPFSHRLRSEHEGAIIMHIIKSFHVYQPLSKASKSLICQMFLKSRRRMQSSLQSCGSLGLYVEDRKKKERIAERTDYKTDNPVSKQVGPYIWQKENTHTHTLTYIASYILIHSLTITHTHKHVSCERMGQPIPGGVILGEEIKSLRKSLLTPCALNAMDT